MTDLPHWLGRWWCSFREAAGHVAGDGAIRVIVSADSAGWESAAVLTEKEVDLRDPKLSVAPDGRLMLVCNGSIYLGTKELKGRRPRVSFSKDGHIWTTPEKILAEGDWLWRVTWHEGTAWGEPDLIVLPDGRWIAGTRIYAKAQSGPAEKTGTIIARVENFQLTPLVTLPSGGDTSYSAFVLHDGLLWASYYSSHEGKSAIYLAKVRLRAPGN